MDKLVLDKETKNAVVNESAGLNPTQMDQQLQTLKKIGIVLRDQMVPGVDYGVIPGTEKPTLLQCGAEKILICLGITDQYKIIQAETLADGSYEVIAQCELYKKGQLLITKMALFNSNEKKGRSNHTAPKNTCLQMAQKRALVSATKRIGALSGVFTQEGDETFIKDTEKPREQRALIGGVELSNGKISKIEASDLYATLQDLGVKNARSKMRDIVKSFNVKLKEQGEKHIMNVYSLKKDQLDSFLKHMTDYINGSTTDEEGEDYV